jgi:hypothetical protein
MEVLFNLPATWTPNMNVWNIFIAFVETTMMYLDFWLKQTFPSEVSSEDKFGLISAFGEAIGALFGGLKAAMDVLFNLPATWNPNAAVWDAFITWVENTMERLTIWVNTRFPSATAATFEPVKSFGDAMGSVFGGLVGALDLFKGLQGYIPLLNSRIDNFIASVTYAYGLLQTYATGEGVQAGAAAVKAFAEATSALFSGLGAALQVFGQLAEGTATPIETFKIQMAGVIERVNGVMIAFKEYVMAAVGSEWLPAAQTFLDSLSSVIEVLQKALGLFTAVQEHGLPTTSQLQDFLTMVMQVFAQVSIGLQSVGTDLAAALGVVQGDLTTGTVALAAQGQATGLAIADGVALGILAGLPGVQAALVTLAATTGGMLGEGGQLQMTKTIIIEFRGQAGGGVPMDPDQFELLKNRLSDAVRLGA